MDAVVATTNPLPSGAQSQARTPFPRDSSSVTGRGSPGSRPTTKSCPDSASPRVETYDGLSLIREPLHPIEHEPRYRLVVLAFGQMQIQLLVDPLLGVHAATTPGLTKPLQPPQELIEVVPARDEGQSVTVRGEGQVAEGGETQEGLHVVACRRADVVLGPDGTGGQGQELEDQDSEGEEATHGGEARWGFG